MATINILDKQTRELIAAGEVVERPASAIKELIENSIDAGATHITVEIEHGGITLMRITDDGCGIAAEDVEKAFMRHATSKIATSDDLNKIGTLGFRGEALAAISAVARINLITKTEAQDVGIHFVIEGGEKRSISEVACPTGTILEVRDLFYNTPARMKFLKKDTKEGANVGSIIERVALSHPEIAFKFIKDGKLALNTTGSGSLKDAVYEVLGRDIALGTIPIEYELNGISVSGLISKPFKCKPTRNLQLVFLNGRFVKSGTVMAALDVGYKNSAMVGKFPYCIINITMPLEAVDVNVHPAKTEVRFEDESAVFNVIHYGVKNALERDSSRPEISLDKAKQNRATALKFMDTIAGDIKQDLSLDLKPEKQEDKPKKQDEFFATAKKSSSENPLYNPNFFTTNNIEMGGDTSVFAPIEKINKPQEQVAEKAPEILNAGASVVYEEPPKKTQENPSITARFIGELFKTYILAEEGEKVLLIDKHAAHERILFEKLKQGQEHNSQLLLAPRSITLPKLEHSIILENLDKLNSVGFDIDDFGENTVILRAVPSLLSGEDYDLLILEMAENLNKSGSPFSEKLDRIYHTVACKSAVKAGYFSSEPQLIKLMEEALANPKIKYCPHGRPITIELKKSELEKMFGRLG